MNDLSLYEMDEEGLLSIFPAEIWEKEILPKLRDSPESMGSCANASPYFQELLKDQRAIFLFPEVVDILAVWKGWELYEDDDEEEDQFDWNEDDSSDGSIDKPQKMRNKWRKTILKCRLVCSAWNKAIEKCSQQPKMTGIPVFVQNDNPKQSPVILREQPWTKVKISFPWKHREFLKDFKQSHWVGCPDAPPKNPFLGRYVILEIWDTFRSSRQARPLKALRKVKKIMEWFGSEIWYLELDISLDLGTDEIYLKVKEWLDLMPNLKYLKMETYDLELVFSPSTTDLIERNPLAKLEKLEALSCSTFGDLGSELIRRNEHISYLYIHPKQRLDENIGKSLTNLKSLTIHYSPSNDNLMQNIGADLKQLRRLRLVGSAYLEPSKLFKILENNWAELLTILDLGYPFSANNNEDNLIMESKDLRLNLPRVRKLSVHIRVTKFCFLDFALPMAPSLGRFEMSLFLGHEMERAPTELVEMLKTEQIVEFIGFEERMEESNIWKIFGKLEVFKLELCGFVNHSPKIKWRVYSREEGNKIVYQDTDRM